MLAREMEPDAGGHLIDGHALAYRTFFAITRGSTGGFTTRNGEPTAGVFGFTSVLLRLLEQDHPDYLAVAFDLEGPTVRQEKFESYKATRKPMPEELVPQIPYIRKVCEVFRVPAIGHPGYEADDVIGTLARKA
jgi:DNA polymerase-1